MANIKVIPLTSHSNTSRYLTALLVIIIAVSIALWLIQEQTHTSLRNTIDTLNDQNQTLTKSQSQLNTQQKSLEQTIEAQLQINAVQKETEQSLLKQLDQLQNEVIELNQAVDFYQGIMQGSRSSKLQIRELLIFAEPEQSQKFTYKIIITQGTQTKAPITGKISLTLIGERDKKTIEIPLAEYPLNLRHVQIIEDQFELSDDITPNSITAVITRKKQPIITRDIAWKVSDDNHPS